MPRIRILLDQNTPIGLRRAFPAHDITHADALGWGALRNGELIQAAEAAGFAVMITCDRNLRYQQNLADRRLAVIELSGGGWPTIRAHLERILAAIEAATPGDYRVVALPRPVLRRRPYSPSTG